MEISIMAYYTIFIILLVIWNLTSDRRLVGVMLGFPLAAQALLPWILEMMERLRWSQIEIFFIASLLFHGFAILRTLISRLQANQKSTTDELQLMRG